MFSFVCLTVGCLLVCTALVVLSRRDPIQSGGRGIIMTSARRPNSGSRPGGTRFSAGDDEEEDRDDDLYSRYIAPWRPQLNATDKRSSRRDGDERQTVKITGASKVSEH